MNNGTYKCFVLDFPWPHKQHLVGTQSHLEKTIPLKTITILVVSYTVNIFTRLPS